MKKMLLLVGVALTFVACQQKSKVTITGELTNLDDQKVYLKVMKDGAPVATDSAMVKEGKFTINTNDTYPRAAYIVFETSPRAAAPIIIEEGNYNVKGDFKNIREVEITGSKTYELMKAYKEAINPAQAEMAKVDQDFRAAMQELKDDKAAINAKRNELIPIYEAAAKKLEDVTNKFVAENNNTIFAAWLVSQSRIDNYDDAEAALAKLATDMPKNSFTDNLNEAKNKFAAIRVGNMAPDFTVKTPEDTDISLSSLKGQVVLVDFWASWCGPCRGLNPSVVALYNKYKDQGFTVFGVSLDDNKGNWVQAIKDDNLTWNHGSDLKGWACAPAQLYCVSGIPHTFLIDKDGKIAGDNLHGEELDAKVAELLAK